MNEICVTQLGEYFMAERQIFSVIPSPSCWGSERIFLVQGRACDWTMTGLLHQTIETTAASHPNHDAFRCQGESLTYSALNAKSNCLAHLLVEEGTRRGDRVGVYMPRCLASAVAVFGIMKAGAAYVSIDPHTPIDSLWRLIDDCGIRHLITHDQHSEKLGLLLAGAHELSLLVGSSVEFDGSTRVRPWETLDQFPAGHATDVPSGEKDLAYIM